jgi:hypothetical protein
MNVDCNMSFQELVCICQKLYQAQIFHCLHHLTVSRRRKVREKCSDKLKNSFCYFSFWKNKDYGISLIHVYLTRNV